MKRRPRQYITAAVLIMLIVVWVAWFTFHHSGSQVERGQMAEEKLDPQEEAWLTQQRETVVAYLAAEGCQHGGVAPWPAFHLDPYVALWAIQSPTSPGRIGWWAISGDLPTDYMSSSSGYHPRDALRHFSREWLSVAECMREGQWHPGTKMGTPELWPKMAPLLEARAHILKEYADDDELWEQ